MTLAVARPHLPPQALAVLELLRERESVSAIEALSMVGCFRLAARVAEIRAAGYAVESEYVSSGSKRWVRYRLIERPAPLSGEQLAAFG